MGKTMRKIVAGLFISLDGAVETPEQWHFPYFSDDMGAVVDGQMADSDTMLLGRNTYQAFADYWPHHADEPPGDFMNDVPKVVVSTTLDKATWEPVTVIKENVNERLTALKSEPGKDISITGSPTLVRSLLRDGVLDELRLLVHPIVVGHGQRLFEDTAETIGLELVSSRVIANGVLYLVYAPAPVPSSE
jgi:dihydrofolate reductase